MKISKQNCIVSHHCKLSALKFNKKSKMRTVTPNFFPFKMFLLPYSNNRPSLNKFYWTVLILPIYMSIWKLLKMPLRFLKKTFMLSNILIKFHDSWSNTFWVTCETSWKLKIFTKSRAITLKILNKFARKYPGAQLHMLINISVKFHDSR
jgi:hypothetical protein